MDIINEELKKKVLLYILFSFNFLIKIYNIIGETRRTTRRNRRKLLIIVITVLIIIRYSFKWRQWVKRVKIVIIITKYLFLIT